MAPYEISMGFLWTSYELPMGTCGLPVGFLVCLAYLLTPHRAMHAYLRMHHRLLGTIVCMRTYMCTSSHCLFVLLTAIVRQALSGCSEQLTQAVQLVEHKLYSNVSTCCAAL